MVVLLDNIRSLHNVGSIFRTSDAVGVEKLYLCGITAAPKDRFGEVQAPLAKVALGAENTVPWEKVSTTARCIETLKKQGFKIVALEIAPGAVPYYELRATRHELDKLALVVGAEVKGISPAILKKCDTIIEIPMRGKKESLNVAVSFGVAAYQLSRALWRKKS